MCKGRELSNITEEVHNLEVFEATGDVDEVVVVAALDCIEFLHKRAQNPGLRLLMFTEISLSPFNTVKVCS